MMRKLLVVLILFCVSVGVRAQVGIGTPDPNPSALLELQASDKGILIPRVELQSTTDAATIANGNVESLLVFNTATVADVQPGYYYWYGTAWHRLAATDQLGDEVVTKLVKNADGTYTYYNETAIDDSGNVISGQGVVIDVVGDVVTNIKEQGDIYKEIIGIVNSLSGQLVENNDGSFSLVATDNTVLGTIDKADLTKNTGAEEGTYTFTNQDGSDVTIDVPADVVTNIDKEGSIYTKIIEKLTGMYGNVYFDATTKKFYYIDDTGTQQPIDWSDFNTVNVSFTIVNDSLTIEDSAGNTVQLAVADIAKNTKFVTELTENQEFIDKIIEKLNGVYGNVYFDPATKIFYYIDEAGVKQPIDWSDFNTVNVSFTIENDSLTITDSAGNIVQLAVADIAKNTKFVTELTENQEFIDKIIEKLNGVYGNVYFDPTLNEFYYYDDQGVKQVINLKDFVGDKIVNETIIYTGDSINGEAVALFKTTTTIAGTVPSAVTAGVTLPETPTGVVSISVYKGGILLTSSVTDMTITGTDVAFNLGLGSLYHAFAPGTYDVIIYFTVAAPTAP